MSVPPRVSIHSMHLGCSLSLEVYASYNINYEKKKEIFYFGTDRILWLEIER